MRKLMSKTTFKGMKIQRKFIKMIKFQNLTTQMCEKSCKLTQNKL